MFDQDIRDTLRIADAYVDDKKRALHTTADKEKSLRAECERIVKENDRLLSIQSGSVEIHREVTNRLDNDLKSMITDHNKLDQQCRESKLQSRLDREEFERLIQCGVGRLCMREESSGYTIVRGNYKLILYNKEGGY